MPRPGQFKGKVKAKGKVHPRTGNEGPEGQQRYSSTLCLTSALDRGWVVNATPRPLYPPGKETRYPLSRRLGGPQGRSERARKISPPPGFYPPIVQPVASRYTDYAIPAHFTPGKDTRYPLYWRLGGPQGRSEQVRKISPPPGFDLGSSSPQRLAMPTELHTDMQANELRAFTRSEQYDLPLPSATEYLMSNTPSFAHRCQYVMRML